MSKAEVDAVFQLADESPDGKVPGATPEEARAAIAEKVRENRLRRMAERQGLRLEKSRRRDPRATDYGMYWLMDANTHAVVCGGSAGTILDSIEEWLTSD